MCGKSPRGDCRDRRRSASVGATQGEEAPANAVPGAVVVSGAACRSESAVGSARGVRRAPVTTVEVAWISS